MIALVIAACLATSDECREVPLLYDAGDVSLLACMISGQSEVARWAGMNPDWRVTRWHCTFPEARMQEA
jgi:hypothetical protein